MVFGTLVEVLPSCRARISHGSGRRWCVDVFCVGLFEARGMLSGWVLSGRSQVRCWGVPSFAAVAGCPSSHVLAGSRRVCLDTQKES